MASNSDKWRQDAARIAPRPSAVPTYKTPPPTRQREVTNAEINRIRTATINKAKSS